MYLLLSNLRFNTSCDKKKKMFLFNEFSSKATYNKGIQRCGIQPKNRKNYANTIILLNILKSFKCYIKKI